MTSDGLSTARELQYFTDPMCSWCYGFAPELRGLLGHLAGRLPLRVIPAGLRPGESQPMPAAFAEYVLGEWQQIARRAGCPFDFGFFERHPSFVYDTRPACKAVAVARRLAPELALDYLDELQERFYAHSEDPTHPATFAAVAERLGLDPVDFHETWASPAADEWVDASFRASREAGVMGYPTLLLDLAGRRRLLAVGWQPAEQLIEVLEGQLARHGARLPAAETGETGPVCVLDGDEVICR